MPDKGSVRVMPFVHALAANNPNRRNNARANNRARPMRDRGQA